MVKVDCVPEWSLQPENMLDFLCFFCHNGLIDYENALDTISPIRILPSPR